METFKFYKVRRVKSPQRAHWTDAGIDFFIPDDMRPIALYPHQRICIPSGIQVVIPYGYALIAFNKSGVSQQYGVDKLAEVIDYGYEGEIHISIVNTSDIKIMLEPGQKILQFVLVQIGLHNPVESLEPLSNQSERGEHGFGSTGEK